MARTVVFIHGMFMTARCWRAWQQRFEARGCKTLAPAWPHHDGEPAAIRARHPDAALGALTLEQVVEHHVQLLATLDGKPVVVGHSMGGLVRAWPSIRRRRRACSA
jgi:pimeloyl-ACP methyl ester carboxylesterase